MTEAGKREGMRKVGACKATARAEKEQVKAEEGHRQSRHTGDKERLSEEVAKEVVGSSRGQGRGGEKCGISQEGSVGRGQEDTIGGHQSGWQKQEEGEGR